MDVHLTELQTYAESFIGGLPKVASEHAHVVGLRGNLGAGKTAFVQEVARALGVKSQVTSPTFVLVQTYDIQYSAFKKLVHIDAYRLEGEEKDTIGFGVYLADPKNLVLVEWPENLPKEAGFPEGASILNFETIGENVRRIMRGV